MALLIKLVAVAFVIVQCQLCSAAVIAGSSDDNSLNEINGNLDQPATPASNSSDSYPLSTSNSTDAAVDENPAAPIPDRDAPPPVFMKVPYGGNRIKVFKTDQPGYVLDPTDNAVQFYYEPALLMNSDSIFVRENVFTNSSELILPLFMWDAAYEQHMHSEISIRVQAQLPPNSVQMLLFDSFKVQSSLTEGNYTIESDWMPYATQPGDVNVRFLCGDAALCDKIKADIQQVPDYFVSTVQVFYQVDAEDKTSNIVGAIKLTNNPECSSAQDSLPVGGLSGLVAMAPQPGASDPRLVPLSTADVQRTSSN